MCIKVLGIVKYVVIFNFVLCINICILKFFFYLMSEMKWYIVFILIYIENIIKIEVL